MIQHEFCGRRVDRRASASYQSTRAVADTLEQRILLATTPAVEWSRYIGGAASEVTAVAFDSAGNAWVTGATDAADIAGGGFDAPANGRGPGGFVAKINADGTLAWSAFLGTSGGASPYAIAIDPSGKAWVAGETTSSDLPGSPSGITIKGYTDVFVTKINANGTVAWSTYLQGSLQERASGIAFDPDGNGWITGPTLSSDFIASGGFDTTFNGGECDGFVAKINSDGGLAWSSFLGGNGWDRGGSIAVDEGGSAWVIGATASTDLASGGFDTSLGGLWDDFVAKINPDGSLAWESYLGGNGSENSLGTNMHNSYTSIATDASGNAWVTGWTDSTDFAIGGFDTSYNAGSADAFVAKINASGTLAWSSYLGGSDYDYGVAITIDANDSAWVAGLTASDGWTSGGFDTSFNGFSDAFVAKINANGTLAWSTFLGGGLADAGYAIAIDHSGSAWVTGRTYSRDFPTAGLDTTYVAGIHGEGFITKIGETPAVLHAPVAYDQSLTTSMNLPINGTMIASDPDRDPLTYAVLTQPTHGNVSFTTAGAFTYTPQDNYDGSDSFTYKANDGTYDSNIATISITITRDLQANVSLSPSSILENQPVGTFIGNLSVSGPDATPPFTYSLIPGDGDDNNASFSISGDQLFSAAVFDFETTSSYSIRVRATDSLNHFFEQAFTITVMNVNEAPTDLTLTNTAIPENQPPGLHIGQLFTVDPDIGDTFTYTLIDGDGSDDNASFTITGNQLLTAATFDLAGRDTYSVRIRTTDAGGLSFEKAFTLHVIDTVLSSACVPENRPSGTLVGTLSCSNPDYSPSMSYELVQGDGDTDNASFIISGNQLCTATPFNYEWKNSYSLRIRTNGSGVSYENSFVISILNVNESPTNVLLSGKGIPEDQPIGTTVGRLSATDSDGQDSFTYILVPGQGDDDNASFTIRGDRLVTAVTFDYVPWRDYSVRIRATDGGGLSVEQNVWKPGMVVFEYGLVDGRVHKTYKAADTDGDVATFNLSGGGQGSFWDNQIGLLNTTARSVLSISVKRGKTGDGLFPIGDIVSDGLLKSINAKGIILTGQVLLDTLNKPATAKAALSMTLAQMNGAEILPQNLPLSSITVSGDVSNTRILTSGSLGKFTAASLHDSQILLGISPDFDGLCATSPADFIHPTARLGTLTITGKKVSQGQPSPAYITGSHISAPTLGTITLANVPATSGPILHVQNDTGTLKLTHSKLTIDPMLSPGTWKTPGTRPTIWQVL